MVMAASWVLVFLAFSIFFFLGAREWYFALLGTLNLAMTAVIVAGIAMQSKVLPRTFAGCNSLAASWHEALPMDMRDSPTASEASLHSACKRMVEHWAFAVAIVVLYFPYALLMIFHGLRGIMHPRPPRRSRPRNTKSVRIQAAIYFAFRYIAKLFQRLKPWSGNPPTQEVTREANGINQRSNIFTRLRRGEKSAALPLRVMPSNVLLKIASYAHYVDIVNLHTAYGSLFLAYIGNEDEESKLEELRMYTCSDEQAKQECRLCRAQICESCWRSVPVPQTIIRTHLESCKPNCSRCFYKNYNLKQSEWCSMDAITNKRSEFQHGHYNQYENVCRGCAAMTDSEKLRVVELQDKAEMHKFSKGSLFCADCKVMLPPSGPRWWICLCGEECRHHIHPPWGLGSHS
ncbi:hypothetical protein ABOM_006403 [Aspergillus bombycis]|uniref:Uncharacterized protein n=1 Tax=Aspergillus bombycis TaxID=109264 RepID=A0A1F8A1L0_9EURO|nr:hypothetical protein ABOM_006403 [Aspergillus bombycis]OGM45319.1 hypothetical protein ABOM_006403 [Aspergillus bombycis]